MATDLVQAGNEFSEAFIRNGARPSGIIRVPSPGGHELRDLQRGFEDSHGGARNAHRVAIVTGDVSFEAMTGPLDDLQFVLMATSCGIERCVRGCPQQCNAGIRCLPAWLRARVGRRCVSRMNRSSVSHSPVWTDGNKASFALVGLWRRIKLLGKLRREAIAPLIEMARWKSKGRDTGAHLLGRSVASPTMSSSVRARGEREGIINAALKRQ